MTVKLLVTGVTAAAAIGVAAAGMTAVAAGVTPGVQPVVFGAPLPLDPAPAPPGPDVPTEALPTADQLNNILINLADAGVSYHDKDNLVEGGIQPSEGHLFDHELRKAYRHGELPLTFNVSNIAPAGPNAVIADVAVSGPKFPAPIQKNLRFVDQGGWMLSRDSAMDLMQEVAQR